MVDTFDAEPCAAPEAVVAMASQALCVEYGVVLDECQSKCADDPNCHFAGWNGFGRACSFTSSERCILSGAIGCTVFEKDPFASCDVDCTLPAADTEVCSLAGTCDASSIQNPTCACIEARDGAHCE